ncbi:YnfA family protein [Halarcobacter anaerophilus]|uniref:YnfA family protein n=1 Tax=Halarcobacter anaerophilus TaxID=877500 RepID=UPI00069891B2|nr:YnfA family protein [Halarcobacter anaerophilus]
MIFELIIYFLAALFEIFGCYSFWMVFKLQKSYFWLIPGFISLILFAFLLTKINLEFAGRAYAVYGGIYIVSSLIWLFIIEKQNFNKWDILGSIIVFIGITIILLGNKGFRF